MTRNLDTEREPPVEARRQRMFRIRMLAGAGCFMLANFALYQWGGLGGTNPWRFLWAALPLAPIAWIVVVIVLRARQLDEYQVKLLFPGLAVGFAVAMVTAITMGMLSSAGLALPNIGWSVGLLGLVAWAFTNLLVRAPKT